jgi:hypothetical protein
MSENRKADITARSRTERDIILREERNINDELGYILHMAQGVVLPKEVEIDTIKECIRRCGNSLGRLDRSVATMYRLINNALSIKEDTTE